MVLICQVIYDGSLVRTNVVDAECPVQTSTYKVTCSDIFLKQAKQQNLEKKTQNPYSREATIEYSYKDASCFRKNVKTFWPVIGPSNCLRSSRDMSTNSAMLSHTDITFRALFIFIPGIRKSMSRPASFKSF